MAPQRSGMTMNAHAQAGFSIVEVMVGLMVGILVTLAAWGWPAERQSSIWLSFLRKIRSRLAAPWNTLRTYMIARLFSVSFIIWR